MADLHIPDEAFEAAFESVSEPPHDRCDRECPANSDYVAAIVAATPLIVAAELDRLAGVLAVERVELRQDDLRMGAGVGHAVGVLRARATELRGSKTETANTTIHNGYEGNPE